MHNVFLMHEMLAPSCHGAGALYGAAAVSGLHATGLLVREALRIAQANAGRRS